MGKRIRSNIYKKQFSKDF